MKLFLKKLLCFSLVCAAIAFIANLAFYLIRGSMTPAYVDRFLQAPEQIQVANLGNSHGQCGFLYSNHPELACVNLGFGSQSLEQDERVLLNYIDRFSKGATLYIPVTYPSLRGETADDGGFLSLNRRYYYFMRRDLIMDFSWREWLEVKSPGLFISDWTSEYWKEDEFEIAEVRTADMIDIEADAEAAVKRHILSSQKDGAYTLSEDKIACLERIVNLCREHDVTPILITTPFLREYNDLVPEEFLEVQQSFLTTFADEEDIQYLDYARDVRFIDRPDLFLNSDHLNEVGAMMFTDLILAGDEPVF